MSGPTPTTQRLSLVEAARVLGLHPESVRRKVRKGQISASKDNAGKLWITLAPEQIADPVGTYIPKQEPKQGSEQVFDLVRALREQLAERDRTVEDLRAERDRLLGLLEQRQWPGLLPWLRRVWLGRSE